MNAEKLPVKFKSKNKKRTAEKLGRFIADGKDKLHLIIDFDRTLTLCRNDSGGRMTTWGVLNRKLPGQIEEETMRLYRKYRPLEVSGKMTTADAVEWWSTVLSFYAGRGLKLANLVKGIKEILPARPGVKLLFDLCEARDIPTIIISAGVKNVIDLWCREYGIHPARILSTNLNLDSQGYICGWEKDSLVHVFNKREKGHDEVFEIKKQRPNTLLIGDSIDDATMADGDENILRLIIDNPRADDIRSEQFYDQIFEKFDLLLPNEDLAPLVEIIESIN